MFEGVRFPLRTAGFVSWTLGLYALLELDTALSARAMHAEVLQRWQSRYGRGLLKIWGLDVRTENFPSAPIVGVDSRGVGRVFVMNHRSAMDIFVALAFTQSTIVSRADLAGWPVIGMAARRVGTLFVERGNRASGANVINAMTSALQSGRGVMVFPEGTTFDGDTVRPFHPGAFAAAVHAEAEIVPLGLAYERADTAFGDEEFSVHMKRLSRQRVLRASLIAGETISAASMEVNALRDLTHARVQSLVTQARARVGGPL